MCVSKAKRKSADIHFIEIRNQMKYATASAILQQSLTLITDWPKLIAIYLYSHKIQYAFNQIT